MALAESAASVCGGRLCCAGTSEQPPADATCSERVEWVLGTREHVPLMLEQLVSQDQILWQKQPMELVPAKHSESQLCGSSCHDGCSLDAFNGGENKRR